MTRPGAPLSELLLQAGSREVADGDAHVYRAALRVLTRDGTRHATVEKVAAEAGLSRMTLFRKHGSKDEILAAALAWGMSRLFQQTVEVVERTPDVAERVADVFVLCCRSGSAMLPASPEERAALFADDRLDAVAHGRRFVGLILAEDQARGLASPGATQARADAIVRLAAACFSVSPPPFDLSDDDAARTYARAALVPIVA